MRLIFQDACLYQWDPILWEQVIQVYLEVPQWWYLPFFYITFLPKRSLKSHTSNLRLMGFPAGVSLLNLHYTPPTCLLLERLKISSCIYPSPSLNNLALFFSNSEEMGWLVSGSFLSCTDWIRFLNGLVRVCVAWEAAPQLLAVNSDLSRWTCSALWRSCVPCRRVKWVRTEARRALQLCSQRAACLPSTPGGKGV